jgi:U-box domain
MASDGYNYERAAITDWLLAHEASPVTHLPLEHKALTTNHALRAAIVHHLSSLHQF